MIENRKSQIQLLMQPRFLVIIICFLLGFMFGPDFGVQKETGALIGIIVGFFLMRYL